MPYYVFPQQSAHGIYANVQEWRGDPSPDLEWDGPFETINLARKRSYDVNHTYDECRINGHVQFDNGELPWWTEIATNNKWTVVALLEKDWVQPRSITAIPDGVLFLDGNTYVIWRKDSEWPLDYIKMPPVSFITKMLVDSNILL